MRGKSSRSWPLAVLGSLLVLFGGWGLVEWFGAANRETMRAWGDVSYAGRPIEQGQIVFTPIDRSAGPVTGAPIVKGSYDVPAEKGPLVGKTYRVAISGFARTGRKIETAPGVLVDALDNVVPGDYNTGSTLEVTISADRAQNRFDFPLAAK